MTCMNMNNLWINRTGGMTKKTEEKKIWVMMNSKGYLGGGEGGVRKREQ